MFPASLNSPLSPRLETTQSKKCLSSKAKLALGLFLTALAILAAIPLFLLLTTNSSSVDTTQTQTEFSNHAEILHLGGYEICSWEQIELADSVLVNGQSMNFTSESVIQGTECSTGDVVILVISEVDGVHGTIGSTRVTADSQTSSRFETVEMEGLPAYDESDQTRAWAEQFKHDQEKLMAAQNSNGRRQLLTPGQIDVHLHLDLDEHMTTSLGEYGAVKYAVELVAVVNRDVYYPLGFNLKVVSVNLRDEYVHPSSSTVSYLEVIQSEGRPNNVNLVHSLTTRGLGGGVAYLGGLYSSSYCYGVSGSLRGDFDKWDRVVVAHELGHNFGAEHTHEMSPQVDNCGNQCPADASGATIMSYCHLCSGGLNNIEYVFHQEVKDDIMEVYDVRNGQLANRQECIDLSAEYPDIGVPFTLKTNECLNMAGTSPTLCELDSAWMRDTESGSFNLRFMTDTNSCWEANCDGGSLSLADCSDKSTQEFEFVNGELRSVACAKAVGGSNGVLTVGGNNPVVQWCSPDSPTATPAPTEAVPCDNSNNGATDPWGDDCSWYDANPSGCGNYDDEDFRSNQMCCSCGGGVNPIETTEEPTTPPGTSNPTTRSPTTRTPTTVSPTTRSPTTMSPTTKEPTSASPTTKSPTTVSPTTSTTVATPNPTMVTEEPTMATSVQTTPSPTFITPTPTVATLSPTVTTKTPTVATASPTVTTRTPTVATASPSFTTSTPTVATGNPTMIETTATECVNSNNGATDPWGDDCAWYEANPSGCGNYDDNDFFSNSMCCVCGGGRDPNDPVQTTASPTPQTVVADPVCYIRQCGCGPDFQQSWCHAQNHQLSGWCAMSEQNCLACAGAWCPAENPETTFGVVTTASPTAPSTTGAASTTTDNPTTQAPTTQEPTTTSPTTQVPTTAEPSPVYEYEEMNLGINTCRNNERIQRLCTGQNSCSQATCQTHCDENAQCMFYFYNTRGRCHLYRSCNQRRRPTTSGVTMMKLLPSTTESTTTETSTTLELSTTQAGDWATGVKLTHFWDCNGMACDAGTLQPWDQSKYVASPGYSPQNPDNHGGAVYGERMWLVGAASDSLSALLGENDPCCGSADVGTGCGKCVLIRVPGALESDWTALVMKKNRCPPWSNGCEEGRIHFDMAVPGYDNLQYSTANVCGVRDNTGFESQDDSAVLGDWYNQYDNTAAAGASLCSTLPTEFVEGCELFSAWGWNRGDPEAEYRVVDCPEAFKAHVAAQFNENGVTYQ